MSYHNSMVVMEDLQNRISLQLFLVYSPVKMVNENAVSIQHGEKDIENA